MGPQVRLLEVGAGTGRISIPLIQKGVDLIGCDLSRNMLSRLHEKFPPARLTQADAARLPFERDSFDCVMTVHVLHLIPAWREVLREIRRVLKPDATYLNVKTWAPAGASIREQVRLHWRDWLAGHGIDANLPGLKRNEELLRELGAMGAQVHEVEVVRYPLHFSLSEELDRLESRIYSASWDIPDAIFDRSMQEVRAWAEGEYGDLDRPREDLLRFAIDVARFDS
jgi:SAM-dependent methyltransferase